MPGLRTAMLDRRSPDPAAGLSQSGEDDAVHGSDRRSSLGNWWTEKEQHSGLAAPGEHAADSRQSSKTSSDGELVPMVSIATDHFFGDNKPPRASQRGSVSSWYAEQEDVCDIHPSVTSFDPATGASTTLEFLRPQHRHEDEPPLDEDIVQKMSTLPTSERPEVEIPDPKPLMAMAVALEGLPHGGVVQEEEESLWEYYFGSLSSFICCRSEGRPPKKPSKIFDEGLGRMPAPGGSSD